MKRVSTGGMSICPTSSALSFSTQLTNLKTTIGLWEDVILKTNKLSSALRTVIQCIAGFLEAFQKIADSAFSSNCGLRDLGSSMTRFCLRERGLESRLRTFNSQLVECLAAPLSDRLEEWRRTVTQLDRENNKEWRRAKAELQRATCEVEKLNKRQNRRKSSLVNREQLRDNLIVDSANSNSNSSDGCRRTGENVQLGFLQHDLDLKKRTLTELERVNLRRAVVEERRRFAELLTCLKPVLESQSAIFSDVHSINESGLAINQYSYDPNDLPSEMEQAIDEAAEHVGLAAHQLPSNDRKFSDIRNTMRFTKQQHNHHNQSTLSGLDASSSTSSARQSSLSGHPSQLSLSSGTVPPPSVTSSSWNAIAVAAAAAGSMVNGEQFGGRTSPQPNGLTPEFLNDPSSAQQLYGGAVMLPAVSGVIGTAAGDSLSLFDTGDATAAGLSLMDANWMNSHDTRSVNLNNNNDSVLNHPTSDLQDRFTGSGDEHVSKTFVQASHENEEDEDEDEPAEGGATTEDTEDGETEDEERISATCRANEDLGKHPPMLYPNQAIPGPVYTNLNELKRAAARKFSGTNPVSSSSMDSAMATNGSHNSVQNNAAMTNNIGYSVDSGQAYISQSLSGSVNGLSSVSSISHSDWTHSGQLTSKIPYADESSGIISSVNPLPSMTQVNLTSNEKHRASEIGIDSGTSTFRRNKQSENTCGRHPVEFSDIIANDDRSMMIRPSTIMGCHSSMTPGLLRRGSQASQNGNIGRSLNRPTNPPRRSSSVSREPARVASMASEFYRPTTYGIHMGTNGLDPGIQRVSSSIFTHPTNFEGNGMTGVFDPNISTAKSRLSRSNVPTAIRRPISPPARISSHYAQPVIHFQEGNFPVLRSTAFPTPPLATVTPSGHSKNSQLLFGVKVLPNQTQAPEQLMQVNQHMINNDVLLNSSIPHPALSTGTLAHTPTVDHLRAGSQRPSRLVLEQQRPTGSHFPSREDAITSFID